MRTRSIRLGSGAGYSGDRIEPAVELAESGAIDYLVFECLAERTIALAQQARLADPGAGFDPLLEARMRAVLPLCVRNGIPHRHQHGCCASAGRGAQDRGDRRRARPGRQGGRRLRRRRARCGARRRLPLRRDRPCGGRARRRDRLGERLSGRRPDLRRARHRRPCRRYRTGRRPGAVHGTAGARVRLAARRLDAARARHGGGPSAGMRGSDHRRLFRRSGLQGRASTGPAGLSDRRSEQQWRPGRDQDRRRGRMRHGGDLQGAASLRDPRPSPLPATRCRRRFQRGARRAGRRRSRPGRRRRRHAAHRPAESVGRLRRRLSRRRTDLLRRPRRARACTARARCRARAPSPHRRRRQRASLRPDRHRFAARARTFGARRRTVRSAGSRRRAGLPRGAKPRASATKSRRCTPTVRPAAAARRGRRARSWRCNRCCCRANACGRACTSWTRQHEAAPRSPIRAPATRETPRTSR